MSKYGKGLAREIVDAVSTGELKEPLTTQIIEKFCENRGWSVSKKYTNVLLANSTSENHSLTYKKYFERVGENEYIVMIAYK